MSDVVVTNVVQETIGPGFIGFTICLSLYGVGVAQTIFYYRTFPHDGRAKKMVVFGLSIIDVVHMILVCDMFWDMLLSSRRPRANASAELPWQLGISFLIVVFMILVVQSFFCLRVWRVSCHNGKISTIIAISALVQFGTGVVSASDAIRNRAPEFFDPTSNTLARLELGGGIVCDGMIAISLAYYFNSYRTGMPRTEPVVQQLIWLSLNTGLLLCLVTTLTMILFEIDPGRASCLAPHFVLSKLYINSMMATLNTRKHFRAVVDRTNAGTVSRVYATAVE